MAASSFSQCSSKGQFSLVLIIILASSLSCAPTEESDSSQQSLTATQAQARADEQVIKFRVIEKGGEYAVRTNDSGDPDYRMTEATENITQCVSKKEFIDNKNRVSFPQTGQSPSTHYFIAIDVEKTSYTSDCAVFKSLKECENGDRGYIYSSPVNPGIVHHWRCGTRSMFKAAMREVMEKYD